MTDAWNFGNETMVKIQIFISFSFYTAQLANI